MKKFIFTSILTISLLVLTQSGHCETAKIITLKDGTTLKGNILYLDSGTYTIRTTALGDVQIPDSDIVSIVSENMIRQSGTTQQLPGQMPSLQGLQGLGTGGSGALQSQVQQLQNTLLADPNFMLEVQALVQDPEIMSLLSDQNFINDILSYDPNRIQGNEKLQRLIEKPAVKSLMDKIQMRLQASGQLE